MIFDLLILQISFIVAYFLRHGTIDLYQEPVYRLIFVGIGLIHICVAVFTESYKDILKRGLMVEFFATVRHVAFVFAGEVLVLFFAKSGAAFSRLNAAYFVMCSVAAVYLWRCIWKKALIKNFVNRKGKLRLLLVAEEKSAEAMLEIMKQRLMLDYVICGIVLQEEGRSRSEIQGIPVVADLDTVEAYLENNVVDEVLFAQPKTCVLPKDLVKKCELMGLTVHIEIPESDVLPTAVTVEQISGISVFSSYVKMVTVKQLLAKRMMDILGSILGLFAMAVLSLFVVPAILISDPGPVIFSQKRVGKNGRIFNIYKFRSMYQDAEARKKEFEAQNQISGPMFKLEADPRIIGSGKDGRKKGLGWFLRTTSLDEFPQFWNVLKGEMSLVGTRPPTIDEWEQYELHHRARMAIKPGITGMWQVSGRSDILDFDEVVRLDTEYIRNWSLSLDLKILVKTVLVIFMKKGAR